MQLPAPPFAHDAAAVLALKAPEGALGLGQWIERAALSDVLAGGHARDGGPLAHVVLRSGAVVAHGSPEIANPAFNRVFIGGEDISPRAVDVAEVLDAMAAAGVSQPLVHVHPSELTPEIEQVLTARRFRAYRRHWVRFVAEPADRVSLPPACVAVRPVEARDTPAVTELVVSGFGLHPDARRVVGPSLGRPGWHAYVACEGEQIIAVGMLLVRGDAGYLGFATTHAAHRRRGAQRALLDKRLRVGFALGCRRIYAETGHALAGEPNPSFDNMMRCGLKPIGVRLNFAREGVRWS